MPEPAERVTRARVVDLLRIAEGVAGYAARSLGNGLEPGAARRAALEAAGDLEAAASALRRLARPTRGAGYRGAAGAGRRAGRGGLPAAQVAVRVGVHPSTVRKWRRRAAGLPRSVTRGGAGILGPVNVSGPGGAGNTVIRGLTEIGPRL